MIGASLIKWDAPPHLKGVENMVAEHINRTREVAAI
jgi:hypothetical protein